MTNIQPFNLFESSRSFTAYHTSRVPLKKLGSTPMWFTKTLSNAKVYHKNTKTNFGGSDNDPAFTYEVVIHGNILSMKEAEAICNKADVDFHEEVEGGLTANADAKTVMATCKLFLKIADGIEHYDYNPRDSQGADVLSVLIFDPAKSVSIKNRVL